VGTLGFLTDAGMLWVGVRELGFGLYTGRVLSFAIGTTLTWALNRSFTFGDRRGTHPAHIEWARYLGASAFGALANYGTYAACVATIAVAGRHPTLAVAAGSVVGLFFNYGSYSRFLYRRPPQVGSPASTVLRDEPR
jgi:putative flippase GtrA